MRRRKVDWSGDAPWPRRRRRDSATSGTQASKAPVVQRAGQPTTSPRKRLYWLLIEARPGVVQVSPLGPGNGVSPGSGTRLLGKECVRRDRSREAQEQSKK